MSADTWIFARFIPLWIGLAAVVMLGLLWRGAPYGRHANNNWGPSLDARWAWLLMESPSSICMLLTFATGRHRGEPWAWLFLAMWLLHYSHRTIVQPFRWKGVPTPMPWIVVLAAVFFNVINGYAVGRWLFHLCPGYDRGWFVDPRFVLGMLLFIGGMRVNRQADEVLRGLRKPGDRGYAVPHGGLYRWVSCPNYLGEMVEWAGFALCTWCLPAAAFAVWTVANLLPRAIAHHRWYRGRFADYPSERRAVIPFVV